MQKMPMWIQPFVNGNLINVVWGQYLQQFTQEPPAFSTISGASPYSYEAKEPGNIFIEGGTISNITLTRGRLSVDLTGQKIIPVAIKDVVTITYSVAPTKITFSPIYGNAPQ